MEFPNVFSGMGMESPYDVLRNYQQEMIDRLEEAWSLHRSVMVQMPTGTGKTVVHMYILKAVDSRASLVVLCLRICLPMQGTWVQTLVQEDPTRGGASKSLHHSY